MANKNLITIDTTPMLEIVESGDKFLFDPAAEEALVKWKNFLKAVKEADDMVKRKLSDAMGSLNAIKIEGEGVKVTKRAYGSKYELTDPALALGMGFAEEIKKIQVNTKEIERYVKDTEELPEGVKLRDRTATVSISLIGEKEDDEN